MLINGYCHFESQKKQNQINTCGSWWCIDVVWSETEHYLQYYYLFL